MAKNSGIPLNQCPTCLSKIERIDESVWGRTSGTYKYNGQEFQCKCEEQIALRTAYLGANIGEQYQRLDWKDFRDEETRDNVDSYLANWNTLRLQGIGLEFSSPQLGTGKTFCASHIGKELIKKGATVWFIPFLEVIGLFRNEDGKEMEKRLRDSTVLILDEVVPYYSEAQGELFRSKLEEIIRHRTNFNRVTIMTTNLTPEKLHAAYPRSYSLLDAKQIRITLEGEDARQGMVKEKNLQMMINGEIRPII